MGWSLPFIARARYEAQNYDHVVVRCEEPFPYLYQDFAHEIITYPVKGGKRDRWLYNGEPPKYSKGVAEIHARLRKEYDSVKLFYPTEDRCKRKEAKWFKYGEWRGPTTDGPTFYYVKPSIFVHARNLGKVWYDRKCVGGTRNWPSDKWNALVNSISNPINKIFVSSVGSIDGAINIDNTIDMRGIWVNHLCEFLRQAKVVVGPSSGPMHLAMLCGCPTVVWTHKIKEKSLDGHTNRWRYEQFMNPFQTPVTVIDRFGWNPPVEEVAKAVNAYLL
jgi:hypothetical protein